MITFASVKIFYLLLYVYAGDVQEIIVSFSVSKRMHSRLY